MQPVKLGSKVKDRVTGFTGFVIGRTEWLTGCATLTVKAHALHEGRPIEAQTFDENMVEVLKGDPILPGEEQEEPRQKGGPRPTPQHPRHP